MNIKNCLKDKSCWVLSEGIAGTENQCIAVAEAMGIDFNVKRIGLREPWKSLSPYIGLEQGWSFSPALTSPLPDILIASGRKSIAASRYIKRASGGKCFTVQIQDPRIDPKHFDLVAVPHHDPTRGGNVIVTDGAPNRITAEKLSQASAAMPAFSASPSSAEKPRIAVLIGGTSKAYTMDITATRKLAAQLSVLDGSLMITASRRTGAENIAILRDALPDAYIWDGAGDNPYFAMIAAADFILVTADSTSMLSDACSSGRPTYMIALEGGHPRIDKLHNHLIDIGAMRVFEGSLEYYDYRPLKDAKKIADAVTERFENECHRNNT